ncbi:hypothetical protein GUJ93_ZPchr0011g27460 [Zizania palustris]|uniref:DUF641 domain-containing protein n=1 Tax=Zizania palustris TaxID=103762 RepID=A0A8J5WGV8_ZIZPA|nr:hypothetical protein GUJ93_ZPchr0011g27460 [Zizania palustris]
MEPRTPRSAARTACSVPGLVLGLSKLCKITKVCAAPDFADTKTEFGDCGGYDQRLVVTRLFEEIGALKSAYIKLQKAHIPYNPPKIAFADEVITSELDSIAALQSLCSTNGSIGSMVNNRWSLVQELEAEMRKKDSDIILLKRELEWLKQANSRLSKQIKNKASVNRGKDHSTAMQQLATPDAFLKLFKAASTSVHDFAEMICSLTASCDHHYATGSADQSYKRYSLEAYLSRTMFTTGVEEDDELDVARFDRIMRSCDPLDALMEYPSSSFARFCRSRYVAAVPPAMESAVFGNLDQRAFVSRGGHPRTWFYRAFVTMARSAWALQAAVAARRRCPGDGPVVRVLYARGGSRFSAGYMESVVAAGAGADACAGRGGGGGEIDDKAGVAFTVSPAVKVGDTVVVPCRVFLCHPDDDVRQ